MCEKARKDKSILHQHYTSVISKTKLNRIFPSGSVIHVSQLSGVLGMFSGPALSSQAFWVNIPHLNSFTYNRQLIPDSLLVMFGCSKDLLHFTTFISFTTLNL